MDLFDEATSRALEGLSPPTPRRLVFFRVLCWADGSLGGIYALERLTRDSPRDRLTIRNILAAVIRNHDFCVSKLAATQCTAGFGDMMVARTAKALPTDVQAALATAVALDEPQDGTIDLSETRFPRVTFPVRAARPLASSFSSTGSLNSAVSYAGHTGCRG
ncbi:hypothetical protein ACWDRB_63480 [Nonomuraea sp. NPDC003707]